MGSKKNIKFKPDSSMAHCQKSTTLFKYIQDVSTAPSRKTRNN